MILHLFRRPSAAALSLYEQIVAQARSPGFYRDWGVSDTLDGRFEMIVLHLFLVLRRLEVAGENSGALGQQVFDCFCQDMDENLREVGVSDLKVPQEMRRVGEAYYGRARAYEAALQEPETLPAVLARNVLADPAVSGGASLADYTLRAVEDLELQGIQGLRRGVANFPKA
jgi:cytochrome b pre-mRNA-processing protein 3